MIDMVAEIIPSEAIDIEDMVAEGNSKLKPS